MTKKIQLGETWPEFELEVTPEGTISTQAMIGHWVLLYFYPRANTPGCTQESIEFSELYPEFQKLGVTIYGISRDSLKRQQNFKNKYAMPFELIYDPEEILCQALDVMKEKKLYGKVSIGIERSTFLFNPEGQLIKEWRKVKAKGHAAEVLDELKSSLS